MSLTFGFYDSINHDRLYNALEMSSIFDGIINDGVYSTIGDHFAVTPMAGTMNVLVGSGRAWFNHTWTLNDASMPIAISPAHMTMPRKDAIVIDVNYKERTNNILVVEGTPASNPPDPVIIRDDQKMHWQYVIAAVLVNPKVTEIESQYIVDTIGKTETYQYAAPYASRIEGDASSGIVEFSETEAGSNEIDSSFNIKSGMSFADICKKIFQMFKRITTGALGDVIAQTKLSEDRVLYSNGNGKISAGGVTYTELQQMKTKLDRLKETIDSEIASKLTEFESNVVDTKLEDYMPKTGGQFNGDIKVVGQMESTGPMICNSAQVGNNLDVGGYTYLNGKLTISGNVYLVETPWSNPQMASGGSGRYIYIYRETQPGGSANAAFLYDVLDYGTSGRARLGAVAVSAPDSPYAHRHDTYQGSKANNFRDVKEIAVK